ncbi:MAG: hypothetical protein ACYDBW_07370, partial [Sulfuricaulis sp.]
LGVPEVRLNPTDYTSFGMNLYRSQQSLTDPGNPVSSGRALQGADTIRLYGEIESLDNSSALPRNFAFATSPDKRINAFGVKWHHHLDTMNSFAISAEYGEGTAVYPLPLDTLDTRAAFSWTSELSANAVKPSITGSVFLGDETTRDEIYRHLGRRYYGFTVSGSMTLFDSHTPYVSFKMQKSLYDNSSDALLISSRSSDRSLLSAGWKWQVQRDVSLQAEASYGLGPSLVPGRDPYNLEQSRIIFGTKYDFK